MNNLRPVNDFTSWLQYLPDPAGIGGKTNIGLQEWFTPYAFKRALKKSNKCRAMGTDAFQLAWLAYAPDEVIKATYYSLLHMLGKGETLPCWSNVILITLCKKGDTNLISNRRPISLMCQIFKCVVTTALIHMDEHIVPYYTQNVKSMYCQAGFLRGRTCSEQAMTIIGIKAHAAEHKRRLVITWIDFSNAYPSVNRGQVFQLLAYMEVPPTALLMIRLVYADASCKYETKYGLSPSFYMALGLFQGCPGSCAFFNLFLSPLQCCIAAHMRGYVLDQHTSVCQTWFVDDGALISDSQADTQIGLDILGTWTVDTGMQVNIKSDKSKTAVMLLDYDQHGCMFIPTCTLTFTTRSKNGNIQKIQLNTVVLEWDEVYTYLGVSISPNDMSVNPLYPGLTKAQEKIMIKMKQAFGRLGTWKATLNDFLYVQEVLLRGLMGFHAQATEITWAMCQEIESFRVNSIKYKYQLPRHLPHAFLYKEMIEGGLEMVHSYSVAQASFTTAFAKILKSPIPTPAHLVLTHMLRNVAAKFPTPDDCMAWVPNPIQVLQLNHTNPSHRWFLSIADVGLQVIGPASERKSRSNDLWNLEAWGNLQHIHVTSQQIKLLQTCGVSKLEHVSTFGGTRFATAMDMLLNAGCRSTTPKILAAAKALLLDLTAMQILGVLSPVHVKDNPKPDITYIGQPAAGLQAIQDIIPLMNLTQINDPWPKYENPHQELKTVPTKFELPDNEHVSPSETSRYLNNMSTPLSEFDYIVATDASGRDPMLNKGIGLYYGPDSLYNLSAAIPCIFSVYIGEAYALLIALRRAHSNQSVLIFTDCASVITATNTTMYSPWFYALKLSATVIFDEIVFHMSRIKKVVLRKVPAHTGIRFNSYADLLAKAGCEAAIYQEIWPRAHLSRKWFIRANDSLSLQPMYKQVQRAAQQIAAGRLLNDTNQNDWMRKPGESESTIRSVIRNVKKSGSHLRFHILFVTNRLGVRSNRTTDFQCEVIEKLPGFDDKHKQSLEDIKVKYLSCPWCYNVIETKTHRFSACPAHQRIFLSSAYNLLARSTYMMRWGSDHHHIEVRQAAGYWPKSVDDTVIPGSKYVGVNKQARQVASTLHRFWRQTQNAATSKLQPSDLAQLRSRRDKKFATSLADLKYSIQPKEHAHQAKSRKLHGREGTRNTANNPVGSAEWRWRGDFWENTSRTEKKNKVGPTQTDSSSAKRKEVTVRVGGKKCRSRTSDEPLQDEPVSKRLRSRQM